MVMKYDQELSVATFPPLSRRTLERRFRREEALLYRRRNKNTGANNGCSRSLARSEKKEETSIQSAAGAAQPVTALDVSRW